MASTVPKSRLLELAKLQSVIFSTTFNPRQQRLGNKVLRQRLKGPTVAAYYPRRSTTVDDMLHTFRQRFNLDGYNPDEEERLENVEIAQLRGKGAPKKIRTKEEGSKGKKKGKR